MRSLACVTGSLQEPRCQVARTELGNVGEVDEVPLGLLASLRVEEDDVRGLDVVVAVAAAV